jgi:ParB family chromosome partitioning protein
VDARSVHLAVIAVNGRLRKLDRSKVKELADSIAEIGLLNPVTVCAAGSEFTLVAGRHRLEAVRSLGRQTVDAVIVDLNEADRRIAEIDENLIRNDLSDLERAEHLAARKRWYLAKHPETKRGGDQRSEAARSKRNDFVSVPSFADDAAQKIGVTPRAVQQDVQIGESIPEDVRDALRDTPLAESKTDLLAMARLPEEKQREVVRTADLNDKKAVRQAVADRQGFACKACGAEQTMKVWHCDGCDEHWLPGEPCGECAPVVGPHADMDEACEAAINSVTLIPTVEAFATAINGLFTPDERRQLVAMIEIEAGHRRI